MPLFNNWSIGQAIRHIEAPEEVTESAQTYASFIWRMTLGASLDDDKAHFKKLKTNIEEIEGLEEHHQIALYVRKFIRGASWKD